MKKYLLLLSFLSLNLLAQAPAGYYTGTDGLSGYQLKTQLYNVLTSKYWTWNYSELPDLYNRTDVDKYYENNGTLLDIYSENPNGADAYEYTSTQMISGTTAEGNGYNREHMIPQSTFDNNYPMYSDLHTVVPVDARINNLRNNYPYGLGGTTVYYSFTNGSKMANNASPASTYTGRVYEPIAEFKGDIARQMLYYVVRYEGKLPNFKYFAGTTAANDTSPLDGTMERGYEQWFLNLMRQWHAQDPVSQREIDRNNEVYALQKVRNPFIDYPQWVETIWNQTVDTVVPSAAGTPVATKVSAYFTNLSWTPSASADVIGYRIYQDGVLIGQTAGTTFTADHLNPSTAYNFTVSAYDNGFLESSQSSPLAVNTLASDTYAKDLQITKYIEGSSNNKAIEITNRTGHDVRLTDYELAVQFNSGGSYYFGDEEYELDGIVKDGESFVIINPNANLSCFSVDNARFVTSSPHMTYGGSNYLELAFKNQTVDALGVKGINNATDLQNVSLYRKPEVANPTATFSSNEWNRNASDYCTGLGTLSTVETAPVRKTVMLFPNPAINQLFVQAENLSKVESVQIYDMSGKLILTETAPFKTKDYISVGHLATGMYLIRIDSQTLRFFKK